MQYTDANIRPVAKSTANTVGVILSILLSCLATMAGPAWATNPGTSIDNIARVRFFQTGDVNEIVSNAARVRIDELLDVTLRPNDGASTQGPVTAGGVVIAMTLVNRGNGSEAFVLSARLGDGDRPGVALFADGDGDGVFDPARDIAIGGDGSTPALAAGAALTIFAVPSPADVQSASPDTVLTVRVQARTGTGPAGTVFPGSGDGGSDAVTGATEARAVAVVPIAAAAVEPTLSKAQDIVGGNAVRGAIIAYTLRARPGAAGQPAEVTDPVPAGTGYVAGSLMLDGRALSDAVDGDDGRYDGAAITVRLPLSDAGATHIVRFQVRIL